jgi:hypothetical protein
MNSLPENRIERGQRNRMLYHMACEIRNLRAIGAKNCEEVLSVFNKTWCNPPLPDKEVVTAVAQAYRFAQD